MINWNDYPNFSLEGDPMLACPCGCGNVDISPSLMRSVQTMRNTYGKGVRITSGVRCAAYNASIGGVDGSAHVPADLGDGEGEVGHAVDIEVKGSQHRYRLIGPILITGFRRVGFGGGFFHLDNDTRKPEDVMFDYYKAAHVA